MPCSQRPLVATLQNGMDGDQPTRLEDADLVGTAMNLDRSAAGGIRHAVEVPADRHHAFMRDPPLKLQYRPIWPCRQRFEGKPFFGNGLVHQTACGRMQADVRNRRKPAPQLRVQIVQIAEATRQEEVLPDIAERGRSTLPLVFAR